MTRTPSFAAGLLLVALQLVLLVGMLLWAALPVYRGSQVILPVEPIDPRDLLRGNYVALTYEFSQVRLGDLPTDLAALPEEGQTLFVLIASPDSIYRPVGLFRNLPQEPPLPTQHQSYRPLQVRVKWVNMYDSTLTLVSDIEAYYCTPEEALLWQDRIWARDSTGLQVAARIRITESGTARLTDLLMIPRLGADTDPAPVTAPTDPDANMGRDTIRAEE